MREILFRGKRTDNGKWVEGWYCQKKTGHYEGDRFVEEMQPIIIASMTGGGYQYAVVDLKTVCQCTCLTDKNGRKIFEGDIVSAWSEGSHAIGRVKQRTDGLWLLFPAWQNKIMWGLCPNDKGETTVEVIGNIFDNTELVRNDA
jgi:uncharacterized phage protein (TIGR01671 family)|nr:YopX family protein [uncultured Acetatifactor sp.]